MNRKTLGVLIVVLIFAVAIYFLKNKNQDSEIVFIETPVTTPIDISGHWFTPHAGGYSIDFAGNKFVFNGFYLNDLDKKASGSYSLNKDTLTLYFNDRGQKDLTLYLSSGYFSNDENRNISYYLENKELGQYFVKSDSPIYISSTGSTTQVTSPSHQTPEEKAIYIESLKANPNLRINNVLDLRDVLNEKELKEIYNLARDYAKSRTGSEDFDLIFQWKKGDWVLFNYVPFSQENDHAQLYLHKVNTNWTAYGMGTGFPELWEKYPDLFSN